MDDQIQGIIIVTGARAIIEQLKYSYELLAEFSNALGEGLPQKDINNGRFIINKGEYFRLNTNSSGVLSIKASNFIRDGLIVRVADPEIPPEGKLLPIFMRRTELKFEGVSLSMKKGQEFIVRWKFINNKLCYTADFDNYDNEEDLKEFWSLILDDRRLVQIVKENT